MSVIVRIGIWAGTAGRLEDIIRGTEWFNIRVSPKLRLALTKDEFEIVW